MTPRSAKPDHPKASRAEVSETKRLSARIERLENQIKDMAKDQRQLHEQIGHLADQLDRALVNPAPTSPRLHVEPIHVEPAPPTTQDAAWRAASSQDFKGQLRSLLKRTRALWEATDPVRVEEPLLAVDPNTRAEYPSLAIVFLAASREEARSVPGFTALERQTHLGDVWLFWDRQKNQVRVETSEGQLLKVQAARKPVHLRKAAKAANADYLLTLHEGLEQASSTLIELALLTLALEPLPFLEVPLGQAEPLLIANKDLWEAEGVNDAAFKSLVNRRKPILGKVLPPQGNRTLYHRPSVDRGWRQAGAYVVSDPRRGKPRQALRWPASVAWPSVESPPRHLLLAERLTGGVERWIADHLRVPEQKNSAVALLQPSDALTRERIRTLAKLTPWIYSLGDHLPSEVKSATVEALRRRFGIGEVLDLRLESNPRILDLPTTKLRGEPSTYCRIEPRWKPGRQHPNLPSDRIVVSQVEDWIPSKRPEDFVALAHHLRDDKRFFFVLAGRGPLAGTLQDLERYLALENLRLITDACDDDTLSASHIVCSMAEEDPWPYTLLEAQKNGLPTLALASDKEAKLGDWEAWRHALEQCLPALEAETTR